MTKSNVTVIPSVGLWRQSLEVFQLVLVPMSNGTENWMRGLAQAVVSINAFKGSGIWPSALKQVIVKAAKSWMKFSGLKRRLYSPYQQSRGFEGGMTNGYPIVVRGVMKPIPASLQTTHEVDIETHEPY